MQFDVASSDIFSISIVVTQGYVLAPALFGIFFSVIFFFCILFVYCFIKLNIQLQQRGNLQHKKGNTIILRTKKKKIQFASLQNIQFDITSFNYKVTGYK